MTNEEIKQLPEIVDTCLDGAILDEVRQHLNEKIDKVCQLAIQSLESSISIPSNATNGDVIKAVFPRIKHSFTDKDSKVYILEPNDILTPILTAFDSWWNAPYREEDTE